MTSTNETQLNARKAEELLNQGLNLMNEGKLAQANKIAAALAKAEGSSEALVKQVRANAFVLGGAVQQRMGINENALQMFERALKLDSNNVIALSHIRPLYEKYLQLENAETAARKLVTLQPESTQALYGLGFTLIQQGKTEEAVKTLFQALEVNPRHVASFVHLSRFHDFESPDDPVLQRFTELLSQESTSNKDRGYIHIAMAMNETRKNDYDKAYEHYKEGNSYLQADRAYDPDVYSKLTLSHTQHFTDDLCSRTLEKAEHKVTPAFVFGLSRTGKSLLESCLSSHENVFGTGKLNAINILVNQLARKLGPYPQSLEKADTAILSELADTYANRQAGFTPKQCSLAIDTMPGNFWNLGLINMLFPDSPLVHTVRDPYDTCLQIFFSPYTQENRWSHSIQWLAHYYLHYRRIMEHWHNVLPEGRILEVCYENLVTNPEKELQKISEYMNIDIKTADIDLDFRKDEIGLARKHYPDFCDELKREMLKLSDLPSLKGLSFLNKLEKS